MVLASIQMWLCSDWGTLLTNLTSRYSNDVGCRPASVFPAKNSKVVVSSGGGGVLAKYLHPTGEGWGLSASGVFSFDRGGGWGRC